jgi:hypothetical protein
MAAHNGPASLRPRCTRGGSMNLLAQRLISLMMVRYAMNSLGLLVTVTW